METIHTVYHNFGPVSMYQRRMTMIESITSALIRICMPQTLQSLVRDHGAWGGGPVPWSLVTGDTIMSSTRMFLLRLRASIW